VADFESRNPDRQIVPDAMRWTMKVKRKIKAGGTTLNHNEAPARDARKPRGLKVRTGVKAGSIYLNYVNHNEAPARDAAQGLKVHTGPKAGGFNKHDEVPARDAVRTKGLKVRTGIKAGITVTKPSDTASPH
jgi:hypothetical protein